MLDDGLGTAERMPRESLISTGRTVPTTRGKLVLISDVAHQRTLSRDFSGPQYFCDGCYRRSVGHFDRPQFDVVLRAGGWTTRSGSANQSKCGGVSPKMTPKRLIEFSTGILFGDWPG